LKIIEFHYLGLTPGLSCWWYTGVDGLCKLALAN